MKSFVFICTGNTCRSPMAEAICKGLAKEMNKDVQAISRGITVFEEGLANPFANEAIKKYGYNLNGHISKQFNINEISEDGILLVMTKNHKNHITNFYPRLKNQIELISEFAGVNGDIADPYGKAQVEYDFCAKELYNILKTIVDRL